MFPKTVGGGGGGAKVKLDGGGGAVRLASGANAGLDISSAQTVITQELRYFQVRPAEGEKLGEHTPGMLDATRLSKSGHMYQ